VTGEGLSCGVIVNVIIVDERPRMWNLHRNIR